MSKIFFHIIALLLLACGTTTRPDTQHRRPDPKATPGTTDRYANDTAFGVITPAGKMQSARAAHTATLLESGKVLIAGGMAGDALSSAEIYDPAEKRFESVGKMSVARAGHTASLLPDGRVLIAGGYNGGYLSSTEIYDPQTQTFSPGPAMTTPRSGHTATLLKNGKILIAGGVGVGWSFLPSAELYDIEKKTFTATGSMTTARESHTATLLKSGNVLITGGHKGRRSDIEIYASAEIYYPISEAFKRTSGMGIIRHKHDACALADGSVLVSGGSDQSDSKGTYRSAELFDPESSSFRSAGQMNLPRYKHNGTSVLLPNGNVLIAGGAQVAEIYQPASGTFTRVPGSMGTGRFFSCAILLQNGEVLVTGGYDQHEETSANAWIYRNSAK